MAKSYPGYKHGYNSRGLPSQETPVPEMTNIIYSKQDAFKQACENAELPATKRQASKYRRKTGKAYAFRNFEAANDNLQNLEVA